MSTELEPTLKSGASVEEPADESHAQEMERREQQHRHEIELQREITERDRIKAKSSLKSDRVVTWCTVACVIGAVAIISLIAWLIFQSSGRGGREAFHIVQMDQQREQQCFAQGGGWVPAQLLDSTNDHQQGLCVFPGKSASSTGGSK